VLRIRNDRTGAATSRWSGMVGEKAPDVLLWPGTSGILRFYLVQHRTAMLCLL